MTSTKDMTVPAVSGPDAISPSWNVYPNRSKPKLEGCAA
jgi:hypothetical protein